MSYYFSDMSVTSVAAGTGTFDALKAASANVVTANVASFLADPGYDVFLLAGQNNMVGAGNAATVNSSLDFTNTKVMQWGAKNPTNANLRTLDFVVLATDPLEHPSNVSQTSSSLGLSFARFYQPATGRRVLLVPAAYPDTGFSTTGSSAVVTGETVNLNWRADQTNNLVTYAIARANKAMAFHRTRNPSPTATSPADPANRFMAVLWHQGSSDWNMTEAAYKANLQSVVAKFRASISGASNSTPFLAGHATNLYAGFYPTAGPVVVLPKIGDEAYFGQPSCFPVSSTAPTPLPEVGPASFSYFSNAGLREFGRRYYERFVKRQLAAASFVSTVPMSFWVDIDTAATVLPTVPTVGAGALVKQNVTGYTGPTLYNDPQRGKVVDTTNGWISTSAGLSGTAFTKSVWVKGTSTTVSGEVLSLQGSHSLNFDGTDGRLRASLYSTVVIDDGANPINSPNAWIHVAVTYSGGTLRLYRNGELRKEQSVSAANWQGTTVGMYIGASDDTGVNDFTGYVSDARVFDVALSATQIAALYYATAKNVAIGTAALDIGLSLWLDVQNLAVPTQAAPGGTLTPYVNTGLSGIATYNDPVRGYVLDTKYGWLGTAVSSPLTFTKAVWIKSSSYFSGQALSNYNNPQHGLNFSFAGQGNVTSTLTFQSLTDDRPGNTNPTNEWVHFAVTFDNTSKTMKLYRNGEIRKALTYFPVTTAWAATPTAPGAFFIGGQNAFGATLSDENNRFKGYMDDIRVYPKVLSASEVATLYSRTSPSLSLWADFAADTLTTLTPAVGGQLTPLNNTGTTGPAVVLDSPARGYVLNTTQGWLRTSATSGAEFTKAAWVKSLSGYNFGGACLSMFSASNAVRGLFFSTNRLSAWVGSGNYVDDAAGNTNPQNQWIHFAVTAGSGTLKMYRNGVLRKTVTGITNTAVTDGFVHVGGQRDPGVNLSDDGNRFRGYIDDARVYNRVLSDFEIASLYSATLENVTSSNGLILWADFSTETVPTTATTGGQLTPQLSPAMTLDATRGYVLNSTNGWLGTAVSTPAQFTQALWIKGTLVNQAFATFTTSVTGMGFQSSFNGRMGFYLASNAPPTLVDDAVGYANSGTQWLHFVVTYANGTLTMYRNGELRKTYTGQTFNGNSDTLFIGGQQAAGGQYAGNRFAGLMDDVRLYNRALSADEVARLYYDTAL